MRLAAFVVVALLLAPTTALATAVQSDTPEFATPGESSAHTDHSEIVAAYPNPTAGGDAGEYVVVSIPEAQPAANATLSDGSTSIPLGDLGAGRVVLSRTPEAARGITDLPVQEAPGLRLANGGETLSIHTNRTVLHSVRYADAPEGAVATWTGRTVSWRPLGATDRPIARAGSGDVRAFVLPDAAGVPADVLGSASDRLWLAGYTLTSDRITDRLLTAHRRGVDVRVLVEGEPIGGRSRAGARRLDRLAAAGVEVRALGGPHDRYAVHHAKYAIVDDRAMVITENWKPGGTGGNGSRGWGVVTGQPSIVANLSTTFAADAGWRDAIPWSAYRAGRSFDPGEPALGSYPRNHDPELVAVDETELLVAPDNARGRMIGLLENATTSIDVVQVRLGGWDDPFAVALRRAASRGVDVRVMLSSAWYVREENAEIVDRFAAWAERTGAPLTARLATPEGRFERVHAKGAIVDGSVVVGSLNWNDHAARHNREVVAVLHGREAAAYYRSVFEGDWSAGAPSPFPAGLLAGVAGAVALAGVVLTRVDFERSP